MDFIEILKVIMIGIVEGITEWLPISSTGHIILVSQLIHFQMSDSFKEMFDVVIQLGAIMAVVVLFFEKLWPFKKADKKDASIIKMDIMQLWFKVLAASVPAAILGLLFDDVLDEIFYNYQTISITLIVYGILFIIIENYNKNKKPKVRTFQDMTYQMAFLIGIFQVLALIPGTSRSGATILGAMLIGSSRYIAAEFSFYLAIPVMFGASLIKVLKFGLAFTTAEAVALVIGMIVAFLVSIIAIKFLMGYIKSKDFKPFGYYRIVLGIILIAYYLYNLKTGGIVVPN